jgi:phospholipid-binding lipoprotein MlaA
MNTKLPRLLLAATVLCLAACTTSKPKASQSATNGAAAQDDYDIATQISDPLEPLNRATFVMNDKIYQWVLTPVSKTYTAVLPAGVRDCIDNVYENAKFPVRFINAGLQGKFNRAGKELQKFAVNTFAGFGGIIKQSNRIPSLSGVPSEDAGQTLAKWGLGHGPYLVLPLLGPSSAREVVGLAGDYALDPINWGFFLQSDADDWAWIPSTGNTVRALPLQLQRYNDTTATAIDPYTAVRSTFVQNRNSAATE